MVFLGSVSLRLWFDEFVGLRHFYLVFGLLAAHKFEMTMFSASSPVACTSYLGDACPERLWPLVGCLGAKSRNSHASQAGGTTLPGCEKQKEPCFPGRWDHPIWVRETVRAMLPRQVGPPIGTLPARHWHCLPPQLPFSLVAGFASRFPRKSAEVAASVACGWSVGSVNVPLIHSAQPIYVD